MIHQNEVYQLEWEIIISALVALDAGNPSGEATFELPYDFVPPKAKVFVAASTPGKDWSSPNPGGDRTR